MSIFSVGLLMSQIDFLLIRLAADLSVNTFTTFKFLKGKEVNPRLYEAEGSHSIEATHELTEVLSEPDDTRPLNRSERP
jgi:hypothetical protein